jgi:hypothetical protein
MIEFTRDLFKQLLSHPRTSIVLHNYCELLVCFLFHESLSLFEFLLGYTHSAYFHSEQSAYKKSKSFLRVALLSLKHMHSVSVMSWNDKIRLKQREYEVVTKQVLYLSIYSFAWHAFIPHGMPLH